MRKAITSIFLFNIFFFTGLNGQNSTKMDTLSYSFGMLIGNSLKNQGIEKIDEAAFMEGLKGILAGDSTKISLDQANTIVQTEIRKITEAKNKVFIEAGESFLAANAKNDTSVVVLDSGLQYKILKAGVGETPTFASNVTVHYEGRLIDGTIFDSSYKRGEPTTFGVGQVIKGWTEALQLMPVGSTWEVYIPYYLAYGERGTRGIPPFSTLVFKVELIEIQ